MITCALVLYASCGDDDSPTKPSEPEKEPIEVYVVESLRPQGYTPEEFLKRWPDSYPPLAIDISISDSNEVAGRAFIHRLGWLDFVEGTKVYKYETIDLYRATSSLIITAPDSLYPIKRIVFLDVQITSKEISGRCGLAAIAIDYDYHEFIARKSLWYE